MSILLVSLRALIGPVAVAVVGVEASLVSEATAKALARKLADGPHIAIQSVKQVLYGNNRDELVEALEHEVEQQMKCFRSKDCGEGVRAFLEKRKPKFEPQQEATPTATPDTKPPT